MRKTSWFALSLVSLALPLGSVSPVAAQCPCPEQSFQLDSSQSPGQLTACPTLHHNGQQNAAFWAGTRCPSDPPITDPICSGSLSYTPIQCVQNPDGSVTASGLVKYRCIQC